MVASIALIPSQEIDKVKWDACIAKSKSSNIYGCSCYLDAMADHWNGLIINGYETVMPLPWRKKWGIRYIYTPPFIQQLGLYGPHNASNDQNILKIIQSFAKYGDYMMSYESYFYAIKANLNRRINLEFDLSVKYGFLRNKYSRDLIRNLNKSSSDQFLYEEEYNLEQTIRLYQANYARRTPHVKEKDYHHFLQLCQFLHERNQCFIRKVSDHNGNKLAVILLLKDKHRLYNLMNITTEDGRKIKANHFLIDKVINEFAGSPLNFDFEGSDLPGVKSFYEHFGAVNNPYYHWHFNNLPKPLRLLKA